MKEIIIKLVLFGVIIKVNFNTSEIIGVIDWDIFVQLEYLIGVKR